MGNSEVMMPDRLPAPEELFFDAERTYLNEIIQSIRQQAIQNDLDASDDEDRATMRTLADSVSRSKTLLDEHYYFWTMKTEQNLKTFHTNRWYLERELDAIRDEAKARAELWETQELVRVRKLKWKVENIKHAGDPYNIIPENLRSPFEMKSNLEYLRNLEIDKDEFQEFEQEAQAAKALAIETLERELESTNALDRAEEAAERRRYELDLKRASSEQSMLLGVAALDGDHEPEGPNAQRIAHEQALDAMQEFIPSLSRDDAFHLFLVIEKGAVPYMSARLPNHYDGLNNKEKYGLGKPITASTPNYRKSNAESLLSPDEALDKQTEMLQLLLADLEKRVAPRRCHIIRQRHDQSGTSNNEACVEITDPSDILVAKVHFLPQFIGSRYLFDSSIPVTEAGMTHKIYYQFTKPSPNGDPARSRRLCFTTIESLVNRLNKDAPIINRFELRYRELVRLYEERTIQNFRQLDEEGYVPSADYIGNLYIRAASENSDKARRELAALEHRIKRFEKWRQLRRELKAQHRKDVQALREECREAGESDNF